MPWDEEHRKEQFRRVACAEHRKPDNPLTGPELLARIWPDYTSFKERQAWERARSATSR